jgi:hypothetical protein
VAQDLLAELRREQPSAALLEIVGDVVDDLVRADLDALGSASDAGLARGDDVEPDDDRLGRLGEDDVRLGDAADRRVQHADLDLGGLDLLDSLLSTSTVPCSAALRTTRISLTSLSSCICVNSESSVTLGCASCGLALALATLLGRLLRLLERVDDVELVARVGHLVDARDLHGHGRVGLLDAAFPRSSVMSRTRPNAAPHDDEVADLELALLDEHVRDRAAALLHPASMTVPRSRAAEVGLELQHLRLIVQDLQQFLDALPVTR